jgi:hypothetical protein
MLPRHRPTPWPWTSTRVGPPGPRRRRSRTPAKRRPWLRRPHGSQARPPLRHPFPSGPMQAGDHAARGPRARRPAAPGRGGPPHRATPGSSAARTARQQRRGHRSVSVRTPGCTGRLDTGRLDAGCPLDRLDGRPTADRTRRTGQRPAGVRTSSRPATTRWAARPRRVTAPGDARPPRTARGDGTGAAALTAATTGQLPSTTRHDAAPRRTAVLGRFRVERRANGEASSVMARAEQARSVFDQGSCRSCGRFTVGCVALSWLEAAWRMTTSSCMLPDRSSRP